MKRQPTRWEKIFEIHKSDKGLEYKNEERTHKINRRIIYLIRNG